MANSEDKRPQFGNRFLVDKGDVFKHNSWDDVEWDEEQLEKAKEQVAKNSRVTMSAEDRERIESEAGKKWDEFYGVHSNKFFKNRNWLFTEFPELLELGELESSSSSSTSSTPRAFLEIGCGNGSTVFPILERLKNPDLTVFCCDFSPNAVGLVKSCKDYDGGQRCTPFVLDATKDNWEDEADMPLKPESLDCALLIFMLSAIEPGQMKTVAANLYKYLKPGGMVMFRDYGQYDLTQLRFKEGKCISDGFYVRGDGTRTYFFTQSEIRSVFSAEAGFEEVQNKVDSRLQVNRGKQQKMYRVWIQAKYRKKKKDDD